MCSARFSELLIFAALVLSLPLSSFGAPPKNITSAERALLPPYCLDAQSFGYGDASYKTSPRAPHWVSLMGKGFWGIHHYCWALINIGRAEKHGTQPQTRKALRESAIGDIDYSINDGIEKSGVNFVLLPELFLKRAEVLLRLRRDREALASYQKSIESKQDYWPAYVGLAQYYKNRGNPEKARESVEQGLKFAPDSKSLKSLLAELDAVGGGEKAAQ